MLLLIELLTIQSACFTLILAIENVRGIPMQKLSIPETLLMHIYNGNIISLVLIVMTIIGVFIYKKNCRATCTNNIE